MTDKLGRDITYLRISVTDKCNLRCRYCMPAEGICKKSHADMLTEEEIITAAEAAAALGITKVRITGGELPHAEYESPAVIRHQFPSELWFCGHRNS